MNNTAKRVLCAALWVLSGCGTDSELQHHRTALRGWDEAQRADSVEVRRASLEAALAADPASPALRRALARELADNQQYADAVALLAPLVPPEPAEVHVEVLWDRAAIHARSGDEDAAAADLRACIALGTDPRALVRDPDFARMAGQARFAELLPKPDFQVREQPPATKVLVGETWHRTITVAGPPGALMVAAVGPMPPALRLVEVVEDIQSADEYSVLRELRYEWRAESPGLWHMPSIQWSTDRLGAASSPVTVEVVQVGAVAAAAPIQTARSPRLPVPSAFDATADEQSPQRLTDAIVVQAPAHRPCRLLQPPPDTVRLVRREGGQPRWTGWLLPMGTDAEWSCPAPDSNTEVPDTKTEVRVPLR
jgi:hypothetical protein